MLSVDEQNNEVNSNFTTAFYVCLSAGQIEPNYDNVFQVVVWDALTAEKVARLPSGGTGAPRWLDHSPTEPAFVTCGNDRSIRFWKQTV